MSLLFIGPCSFVCLSARSLLFPKNFQFKIPDCYLIRVAILRLSGIISINDLSALLTVSEIMGQLQSFVIVERLKSAVALLRTAGLICYAISQNVTALTNTSLPGFLIA